MRFSLFYGTAGSRSPLKPLRDMYDPASNLLIIYRCCQLAVGKKKETAAIT
jgi:hypothetical protein